jgi:hypothetical protein
MVAESFIKVPVNPFGKHESYSKDGKVKVAYTGNLQDNKDGRINRLKEDCYKAIQSKYPWWKQTDASMTLALYVLDLFNTVQGDLSSISKSDTPQPPTEAIEICKTIKTYMTLCNQYETQINACQTLEAVWDVHIDFSDV